MAFLFARRNMAPKEQKTIRDLFTKKEWDSLKATDPAIDLMATVSWQDPDNFTTLSTTVSELVNLFPESEDDSKPSDLNWRDLQKLSWTKYRTFGPLNASVNSKADYVASAGFSVYSDVYEIDLFLKDLFYSYRNRLYARTVGWMIRMLGEGELFILLVVDEEGNITARNLEPSKVGSSSDDFGLLTDPDDVSQALFYKYKTKNGFEFIPDTRFIIEPDYMTERTKALKDKFDRTKISELTRGNAKYKKIGGYRRFILHWKNLTGIYEYKRDTSSLSTVIEWINLYIKALRWGLDHKKALSAYTWSIQFDDTPAGKVAWHVWNKMSDIDKEKTNLMKPLSPGSRAFLMPGMKLGVYNPQIPSLSGNNQDLLNLSGAGARTPQDLWQGQTEGSTYASIRSTRPPLVAEIENLQSKLENFLKYEFLRACFNAKLAMGARLIAPGGKKHKLPDIYTDQWIYEIKNGKPKIKKIPVELCEAVKFTWPTVKLDEKPQEQANASLGSKHAGLRSIGVSSATIAKKFGIDDLSRERRKKALEDEEYGNPVSGVESEKDAEEEFKGKGIEGEGN